jgi:hypothetical protein
MGEKGREENERRSFESTIYTAEVDVGCGGAATSRQGNRYVH